MAITKIQSGAFPADVITSSAIDDLSVTHAKLHTTMDLSSKTVTLPTLGSLNTTGNVGIGTSSIASNTKLIVKAATDQNFEVEYTSGKLRLSALNDARSVNVPLQFASTSFEFLSGKVGIGTDSPAQKLDVTGSIKFSGALMPNNSSGSSGQVLTSSGSGAPSWTTISGGATNLDGLSDAINNNQFNTIIIGSTPNISQNAGYSTGLGRRVLERITTGDENIAMGHQALGETTTGSYNTAMGSHVIFRNTTGYQNSAYGQRALENNTTGYRNVGIGSSAGDTNVTGYNNTLIGYNADLNSNNLTNATAIGANASVNASNKIKLGNSSITNVETAGTLTLGAITIPNTDGSANQVLKTNGSGTLSWTSPSSSSPSIQTPEDAHGVTLNDSDHGKIFSSQHSDYPVFPNPSTLSPGFTCTIVNYSNYDGTLTSPATVSIIGARSNSKYQSKDHTGSVVSVHSNNLGGKQYPVSTIGFMSGGTVVVRVIRKDNINWYYVTGDFYYK